jgi:hypothetical protein
MRVGYLIIKKVKVTYHLKRANRNKGSKRQTDEQLWDQEK